MRQIDRLALPECDNGRRTRVGSYILRVNDAVAYFQVSKKWVSVSEMAVLHDNTIDTKKTEAGDMHDQREAARKHVCLST